MWLVDGSKKGEGRDRGKRKTDETYSVKLASPACHVPSLHHIMSAEPDDMNDKCRHGGTVDPGQIHSTCT